MDDFIMTGPFDASRHEVSGACGTAQDYACSGSVWQADAVLGLIHHQGTKWLHDPDGHRDVVGRTARPESGTLQAVEAAWRDSSDP